MSASDAMSFESELDDPLPEELASENDGEPWGETLARRFGWVVLILAPLFAYSNTFHVPFVFDGHNYIVEKEWIADVWSGKREALEKFFVESQTRSLAYFTFACDYRTSMALTEAFPSLAPKPTGHYVPVWHATSLVIHITAALALYGIARHGFRAARLRGRYAQTAERIALTAALLWSVHPLDTQSVTYLYQRHESLMGMFYFLTLYLFIRFAEGNALRWAWAPATIVACLCGMASKEAMATAPLVVLWYDRVFIAAGWLEIFRRRWWLHAALFATIMLLANRMAATPYSAAGIGDVSRVTPQEYALTQFGVVRHYTYLSVYPVDLNIDYAWRKTVAWPLLNNYKKAALEVAADWAVAASGGELKERPWTPSNGTRFPYLALSDLKFENDDWRPTVYPAIFVLGTLLLTMVAVVRAPAIGFLAGTFFVILAPTSTVVPIVDYCFEHRMYVPLASILTLEIVAADVLLTRMLQLLGRLLSGAAARARRSAGSERFADKLSGGSAWLGDPWLASAVKVTLVVALATLGAVLTLRRNYDYRSQTALWDDAQQKAPGNDRAKYNHGVYLQLEGTPESMDKAIERYYETLKLNKDYGSAHLNLANIFLYRSKLKEYDRRSQLEWARHHYAQLLKIEPMNSVGRYGLADTMYNAGDYVGAQGELERLIADEPNNTDAKNLLMQVLEKIAEGKPAPTGTATPTSSVPKADPNAT